MDRPYRISTVRQETSSDLVGKIGRVTGRITPDEIGEVMIAIRGGTSAYHAYPADGLTTFAVGSKVLVVDYRSPQSVLVDELPEFLR
jgi:hypothetical protein